MRSEDLNDEIERRYGNPEDFISSCRLALQDAGLTQTALAAEAGFDLGHVNSWLNGRVVPSVKTMLILDEALERLLEDL
ncbi:MAG: helix-turn-helix transcriptional regulator [Nitrospiraceae bacterium]